MGPLITVLVFVSLGSLYVIDKLPKGIQMPFGIGLVVVVLGLAFFGRFFRVSISKK